MTAGQSQRSVGLNSAAGAAINLGGSALGFLTGLVVARALGPAGRGEFGFIVTMVTILIMLAGQGMSTALAQAKAKLGRPVDDLYAGSAIAASVAGCVAAGLFAVLFVLSPGALFKGVSAGQAVWVIVLVVPLLILNHWTVVAYLEDRIIEFGVAGVAGSAVYLVAVSAAARLGWLNTSRAISIWALASLVPMVVVLRPRRLLAGRHVRATVVGLFRYSTVTNVATVALVLAWRLDVVLVKFQRGFRELGLYAVAVGLAEVLLQLAVSVRVALTPRQGSAVNRDGLADLICSVNRIVLIAVGLAGVGLAVVGATAIRLLYGAPYDAAAPALFWLLPGVVVLILQGPLIDYLLVEGRVIGVTLGTVAALGVNVGLDVILLQHHTFVAAAVSSTIAYVLSFAICLTLFSRATERSRTAILVPRREDLALLRTLLHRAAHSRARGPSARSE